MTGNSLFEQTILAFDFGQKRIGVAISNPGSLSAEPLTTIDASSRPDISLRHLFAKYQPDLAIVGRPRNLDGQSTAQTAASERFAETLKNRYRVPVRLKDEALSTQRAKQKLGKVDLKTQKRLLDQIAAQIILEDFIHDI